MNNRTAICVTTAVVTALGLSISGCAPTSVPEPQGLSIVASTNVWGDVAQSIAGDNATVTSVITSAVQDPHSYEASARDQLAISKADLVIENGGGYDPFIDALVAASPRANELPLINASETSGLMSDDHDAEEDHKNEGEESPGDHDHIAGFNEHVWYSFSGVDAVASAIALELGSLDPNNADTYQANYEVFSSELATLTDRAAEIGTQAAGKKVAITEPVPLYLLEAVELVNATPAAFSEAFEEGIDIPPTVLRDTLLLFSNSEVVLLAYNDQTTSGQGELVLEQAKAAGVAVVPFSETLPEGQDYISWMTSNLDAVSAALSP
ncbi:MAG: metal ABC transporter solute-binding protein, Zn/Mn family [Microbacteriaceae bacterium]